MQDISLLLGSTMLGGTSTCLIYISRAESRTYYADFPTSVSCLIDQDSISIVDSHQSISEYAILPQTVEVSSTLLLNSSVSGSFYPLFHLLLLWVETAKRHWMVNVGLLALERCKLFKDIETSWTKLCIIVLTPLCSFYVTPVLIILISTSSHC